MCDSDTDTAFSNNTTKIRESIFNQPYLHSIFELFLLDSIVYQPTTVSALLMLTVISDERYIDIMTSAFPIVRLVSFLGGYFIIIIFMHIRLIQNLLSSYT